MEKNKIGIRELTQMSLFVALIAIGAFIKIPIPYLPLTLQFLFTNLAGVILGPYLGALSVLVYVALGLIGVPIFTSGGGPGYVFSPTFGYLVGFILGTFAAGKYLEKRELNFKNIFIASVINLAIVYALGMVYLYIINNYYLNEPLSVKNLFIYAFLLIVPSDLFLCGVSAVVGKRIKNAIKSLGYGVN